MFGMPKLYSSAHIISVLLSFGFEFVSQKGSHAKYRKSGNPTLTAIVPANRKEIPFGSFVPLFGNRVLLTLILSGQKSTNRPA